MLESLQIKNFRIFESLEIPRLKRVNLIVGKNNSGKTCLLEALLAYGRGGDPDLLLGLVQDRDEDLALLAEEAAPRERFANGSRDPFTHPLRNLFHGYSFPRSEEQVIEIGPRDIGTRLRLSLQILGVEESDHGNSPNQEVLSIRAFEIGEAPEGAQVSLVGELIDGKGTRLLSSLQVNGQRYVWSNPRGREHRAFDVRFVPTKHMQEDEVGRLWDRIVIRPKLREHVVNALRLIDPEIREVVMLQGQPERDRGLRSGGGVPVLLYDDETRRPLKSLGDGVSHLFHMILAAAVTKGGVVLFDEFENGLHWSVQPLVWKVMFDLAVELDLQVFATTHSWDCVQAFKDVALEHETGGMLLHLGRSARDSDRGALVVTSYDQEKLDLATRAGMEVR